MLDVLNEDLIAKGEEPIAFDSRLPRRHLRIVRLHDQRHRARSAAGNHGLPAPHAPFQRRRRALSRTMARQSVSPCQGSGRGPQLRSIASSRPADSSPSRPAAPRTPTRILVPKKKRTSRWMPRPVSVAALASPRVPMPRPRYSPAQKSAISVFSPGPARAARARAEHGGSSESRSCSAAARISANAKRYVRRRSNLKSSRE